MKKSIISLILAVLTVICGCTLVGCNDESSTEKWSGQAGELPQAIDSVIEIENGEQLAGLSAAVNGGNTLSGYTVKLTADIDLDGKAFTPIGSVSSYPSKTFAGTFDGAGHTICNLNASSTEEDYASAGLFGSITGVVKNLNLKNVTVNSTHYAGAVVGYIGGETGRTQVVNCHVDNANVTSTPENKGEGVYDNGDKAGGIVGYLVVNDVVDGCSVKNTTVTGYRDIGGIVGYAHGVVKNNTVGENVKIIVNAERNYKNYQTNEEFDADSIIGETSNNCVYENNSGTAEIQLPFEE